MKLKKDRKNNKDHRPTIGLLIDSTIQGYEQAIWHGAVEQAKMMDVNLVTFNVASQNIEGGSRVLNQTIDLINQNNIQGLILASATILDIISVETLKEFLDRFLPLPMLSIGVEMEGIPSLVVDNYQGMREVIDHLIEYHGYRRIAYLQMFGDNPEALERYRGYTESLADHNIPFDPDLIVPGEYFGLADQAVFLLLDKRKIEFDAFVSANDDMATNVMLTLQNRGFLIPDDIAIAGFDDHEVSRFLSPPLTTSRQPLDDLGRRAVELLLSQLDDKKVPDTVNLSTKLIIRQSCGCLHPDVAQSFILDISDGKISGILGLVSIRDAIISEIMMATGTSGQFKQLIGGIFDSYIETISQQSSDSFIKVLSLKAEGFETKTIEEFNWHILINILRRYTLMAIAENEILLLAENLFQQARTLIAGYSQRVQASLRYKAVREANLFRTFSQRLLTSSDQQSLFNLLTSELPKLGIPSCFLVINEQLQTNSEQKKLLLAFSPGNQLHLPPEGISLKPDYFPQSIYFPPTRKFSFIAENIFFQNQDSGFVLLEAGSSDGSLYRGIADQISSALENVFLLEQVEERAKKLQAAAEISRAANNILDPEDLIRKAVDLVKERFNLYYAGIFLVDESHKWAELRAGTGESGANMMAENWRLESGGNSMVGRCITSGEADIQMDVNMAPVHLRNPHLPNTKSELALPLISRGGIIGALTIQSESANAFNNEDITILQTMADQVASSISNAQLFEQTQTALMDTETLLNISRFASTSNEFEIYIQQVLNLTLKSTDIDNGLISIINPKTKQLEIASHQIPEPFLTSLKTNGLEGTLCDLVYQQRKSIIVPNLTDDSPIDASGLIKLGFKSYQGVPLETKGEIFGTLCTFNMSFLQSGDSRVSLLQAIGQQIALAIENYNLFQQTQETLVELAAIQQRYQLQAWSTYNQKNVSSGYKKTPGLLEPLSKQKLLETEKAIQEQGPVVSEDEENLQLTIPVILRDQPIGAIGLKAEKGRHMWSPEEISLVQEISEQFALAAESLRLLDETQRRAARERLISDITTKIRSSIDPQSMIQTTALELQEALQAKRSQVTIHHKETNPNRGDK